MTDKGRLNISRRLAEIADDAVSDGVDEGWPVEGLKLAVEAGWRAWTIPETYGGKPTSRSDQLKGYEMLGGGDLSVALIVTQHDSAVDLIAHADNESLKSNLLPRFANGELQTTVGIAQLTTSRQGGEPAMRVAREGQSFVLNGLMPWATGPSKCSHIVTGGVLDDGSQLLACVPTNRAGLSIGEPMRLLGLTSSLTTSVQCRGCRIEPEEIIRGPVPQALSSRSTVKPLVVSSVGLGVAGAMMRLIQDRADAEPELADIAVELRRVYDGVAGDLWAAAESEEDIDTPHKTQIRVAVNDLVGRLTLAVMTFAKGTGYRRGHPASRLAREGLFMLVWSAPVDVRAGSLRRLLSTP